MSARTILRTAARPKGNPMDSATIRPADVIGWNDIAAAAGTLAGIAHRTPIRTCRTLDEMSGARLFFKCEHLQRVGAFKFRGAYFAISRLDEAARRRGVVTHSSGNHAQAVALAARMHRIPAYIVMPSNAPAIKRRAVEGYGGQVIPCEPTLEARESTCLRVQAETGATLVPPYDHPHIIAGQATIALELLAQVPELDMVVVPIGGGGLIGGIARCLALAAPHVRVIGAEPAGADDAARSKAAGRLIPQTNPRTIADGLRTSLGQWTWPIVRDEVERIVTVSDEDILSALRLAWERAKLLIEPSAAVPLAAVLSGRIPGLADSRVAVVLSGGNVDLALASETPS